jgi:hypothetical protein
MLLRDIGVIADPGRRPKKHVQQGGRHPNDQQLLEILQLQNRMSVKIVDQQEFTVSSNCLDLP